MHNKIKKPFIPQNTQLKTFPKSFSAKVFTKFCCIFKVLRNKSILKAATKFNRIEK